MKERILKGTKVFLRRPTVEDFEEFSNRVEESREFHQNLVNPPIDKDSFANFIKRNEAAENELFLICQLEDKAIAGSIELSQIFRRAFQNAYLGYYLFENFAGKGLMTEAVALTLKYAFKTLKLHRIEANVQPHNVASTRVLERNGFTKEGFSPKYLKIGGRWRDHERWAVTIENWN